MKTEAKNIERLRGLTGNEYMHLGHRIKVMDVVTSGIDDAIVVTDRRSYNLHGDDEMKKFLEGLTEPLNNNYGLDIVRPENQKAISEFNSTLDNMVEVMMRTIEKTEQNPDYVKQATQINKSATQVINAAKLKVEAAKWVTGKRKKSYDDA